jgi:hypothetical protein
MFHKSRPPFARLRSQTYSDHRGRVQGRTR